MNKGCAGRIMDRRGYDESRGIYIIAARGFYERRFTQFFTSRELLLRLRNVQCEMVRRDGAGALSAL